MTYCWGDRYLPYKILSESDSAVTVEMDGQTLPIARDRIKGQCQVGDKAQYLCTSGWRNCTIRSVFPIAIETAKGIVHPMQSMRTIKLISI